MVDILDTKNIIKDPLVSLTYNDIFQPDQNVFTGAGNGSENPVAPQSSQPSTKSEQVVEGTLRVVDGYIGGAQGWTIKAGLLKSEGIGLATVKGDPTWAFWAGNDSPASAEFRVSHTGDLVATSATISGSITATSGRIANWYINTNTLSSGAVEASSNVLIDSANSLIRLGPTSGNYITLDGANLRIRSSNYNAGVAGFTIEPTLVEAENILARGSLRGVTFKYDVISAVGGQLLITNSDVLSTAMTALDSSTMTVRGDTTFAVNDIILIRAVTASGIQEEYLRVTNIGSAPTYTVTRDLAAAYSANSNPVWQAGTTVVKIGKSDGASTYSGGWLRLLGEGTNSPYYSVFSRTGIAYNSYSERVRLGNLNGIGGKVADTYGIFIGNLSAGKYLMYDDSSGDLIVNDSVISNNDVYGDGSDGDVTLSANTTLTADMFYNNLTIQTGVSLSPNGFRVFVKNILTFQGSGKIIAFGGSGGNGGNGLAGPTFAAGAGGTAGTRANTAGTLPASAIGKAGGAGGVGSGGASCGTAPVTGTAGDNVTKSLVGAGGAGGNGASEPSGCTPGAVSGGAAGTVSGTVLNTVRNFTSAYLLTDFQGGTTNFTLASGSGSGGGGGGARNDGAGGGGGGGSGASGGIVWVAARIIVTVNGNDYIQCIGGVGGNGGNGATGVTNSSGGGGGGAGGRGGLSILIYSSKSGTGTQNVFGGAGGSAGTSGTGAGTATAGAYGGDGVQIALII